MTTRTEQPHCPVDGLLHTLFAKWSAHILWVLGEEGAKRFGELKRRLDPVSTKTLTERLRELEAAGLLHREMIPTIPPQVTYSVTERGASCYHIVNQLVLLSAQWQQDEEGSSGLPADHEQR